MNHVVIVRKDKIEKIEMAENLSHLVSIVSKPVNANVLSSLIKNRDNNDNNPLIKTFYENVIRFTSRGERFSDGSGIFNYYGVENVLGDWTNRIRQVMAIIANECGEKNIANFTKPSSTLGVSVSLSSCYNGNRLPHSIRCHSTFTIVTKQDNEEGLELSIKDNDDKVIDRVNVQKGDVFLFTDRYLLEKASLAFRGDVELLSVDVNPSIDIKGQQDMGLEDYLKGNINPTDYVKTTLNKMDTTPFTYKWSSGKTVSKEDNRANKEQMEELERRIVKDKEK